MEENVELAEVVGVAERLEREVFVGALGGVAFVESEADHVGDDAPTTGARQIDEVVPALFDGGAAVANGRDRGGSAGPLSSTTASGLFDSSGRKRPRTASGVSALIERCCSRFQTGSLSRGASVAEGLSEDFVEKFSLKLSFLEPGESAFGFEVGPFDENGVSSGDCRVVETLIGRGVLEPAAQNETIRFGLPHGNGGVAEDERSLHHGGCFSMK